MEQNTKHYYVQYQYSIAIQRVEGYEMIRTSPLYGSRHIRQNILLLFTLPDDKVHVLEAEYRRFHATALCTMQALHAVLSIRNFSDHILLVGPCASDSSISIDCFFYHVAYYIFNWTAI
jgi:hypothetical protein